MGYVLVEVPAMAGDPGHPAAAGPAAITAALSSAGCGLPAVRVAVDPSAGDMVEASMTVGARVREAVVAVVAGGDVPVVLAGSCDVAPAVVAGLGRRDVGVIWMDAHADFNTPLSSVSGFWPGMTVAVVVGEGAENVWGALGWHPVAPERVLLLGIRSLSPEEESCRLERSAINVVRWREGLPGSDVGAALDALRARVDHVYVHLDLDALDPSAGQGIVDPPEAGGLSSSQLMRLITVIGERFAVAGATVATYTPAKDDGRTLAVAMGAIRQLTDQPG